jgi:secondary thiamine-phosphate synthase enzyme
MKSFRKILLQHTADRVAFVNLTADVETAVRESGIQQGLCLVNAMYVTCAVFVTEQEPWLHKDFARWLERLAPFSRGIGTYMHNGTGEDNGDAHLKRQLMGREVTLAVTDGRLDLGPWEQVLYGEFDGRREKRVLVKIIGE